MHLCRYFKGVLSAEELLAKNWKALIQGQPRDRPDPVKPSNEAPHALGNLTRLDSNILLITDQLLRQISKSSCIKRKLISTFRARSDLHA